jgi:hypothetical protein
LHKVGKLAILVKSNLQNWQSSNNAVKYVKKSSELGLKKRRSRSIALREAIKGKNASTAIQIFHIILSPKSNPLNIRGTP